MAAIETSSVRVRVTAIVSWPKATIPPRPARDASSLSESVTLRIGPVSVSSLCPVVGGR